MSIRRGFKANAERLALELRDELKLGPLGRLEPESLAEHFLIPVRTLYDLRQVAPDGVAHLLGRGHRAFSAVTIHIGKRRVIVTNPVHALTRQMNSLCHELSHIVLEHDAETPLNGVGRAWNGTQEREADWLAGCLLIPHEAAHAASRKGHSDEQVAEYFGVSRVLASWRMNSTGARIRAGRLMRRR